MVVIHLNTEDFGEKLDIQIRVNSLAFSGVYCQKLLSQEAFFHLALALVCIPFTLDESPVQHQRATAGTTYYGFVYKGCLNDTATARRSDGF